jgi:hypothetical protein
MRVGLILGKLLGERKAMSNDTILRGRNLLRFESSKGQSNRMAKMSDAQAKWVYTSAKAGVCKRSLAALLGVHVSTIKRVASGASYEAGCQ